MNKIIEFVEKLEKENSLITEAIGDVISISTMNDYDVAMELIKTQFIVIDRQDLEEEIPTPYYPDFELVKIIAGACLKHSDSGEGSFNKEARVILMELEEKGYKIVKNDK